MSEKQSLHPRRKPVPLAMASGPAEYMPGQQEAPVVLTTTGTREKQRQAVVIGAGIAGLLATRVLAEYYEQVLVVERDALPVEPQPRAGTPQLHHLHRLLPRGKMILERLFPGFLDGLLEHGAFSLEQAKSLLIAKDGRTTLSAPNATGKDASYSRALLEWEIRKRVQACAGVRFLAHQDVIGLVASSDQKRITGICVREHGQLDDQTTFAADLIVDASGRSSKLTHWLQELGYHLPEDEQVHSAIGYSTRYYQFPPDAHHEWRTALKPFSQSDGVAFSLLENHTCAMIIGNIGGHYPPTDAEAFEQRLAVAIESYLPPLLQDAQPLGDPRGYRIPVCVRHHFEQMEEWPTGLLVMGDALCNFDPIYGQGMSVAAIEAETPSAERQLLAELLQGYPQHFEVILDEIIPDFSLSFEDLQVFAPGKEVSMPQESQPV